jgi:ATP citrate (pro-S)-lyase
VCVCLCVWKNALAIHNCGISHAQEYIECGSLNALFVMGRSIGLVAHFIDQKRLRQPLYRHDTQDISYIHDTMEF